VTENAELMLAGTALPQEGREYDEFVAAGRRVQEVHDQVATLGAWRIGHLAAAVGTKYGEGRLEQFAYDIGAQANTVRAQRAAQSTARRTDRPWPQTPGSQLPRRTRARPGPEGTASARSLPAIPPRCIAIRPAARHTGAVTMTGSSRATCAIPASGR
jgi:hypothetical protein